MKMKKLFALGIVVPMFSMCVSCSGGIKKITFDEALNFALKNYDQYYYLGYSPVYNVKVNTLSVKDTKIYKEIYDTKDEVIGYEQTYYLDTTIKDLATTIDTDEMDLLHVTSYIVKEVASYISITNALLGYFESSFTLEDNKYLGIYVKSDKVEQVVNIVGGVFALASTGLIEALKMLGMISLLTASDASLLLTASCNNLGLVDRAHLSLDINDLACALDLSAMEMQPPIDIDVVVSKKISVDLDFIIDYSGK